MNTRQAFEHLCKDPERCERAGMNEGTRRSYLNYLKNKKSISLDKMEEWLEKAGYSVKREKIWTSKVEPSFYTIDEIIDALHALHPFLYPVTKIHKDESKPGIITYKLEVVYKEPKK